MAPPVTITVEGTKCQVASALDKLKDALPEGSTVWGYPEFSEAT